MSDKITIVADSTQIARFLECPKLWEYEFKRNIEPVFAEPKDAISMGTLGHKFLEIYYKSIASGNQWPKALEEAMAFKPTFEELPLDQMYVDQVRNRFQEYCYTYSRGNDFVPESPEHLEVGFSEPIYEDCEHYFVIEGRLDLIGSLSGLCCIGDHKWQLRARNLYKKSIQFRNYAMVAHKNMLIINYVRLAKTVNKDTFARDIASFTPIEHHVWKQRLIQIFFQMAQAVKSEVYDQRWEACSGKFGYPCNFTPLCEEWDKNLIELKINQQYKQKAEWKPW